MRTFIAYVLGIVSAVFIGIIVWSYLSPNSSSTPLPSGVTSYTMTEIAKHNNDQSCWLSISGRVYDTTQYIYSHPGGMQEILAYCGQDATIAFDTKGGRGSSHSASAQALLQNYFIGNLKQ